MTIGAVALATLAPAVAPAPAKAPARLQVVATEFNLNPSRDKVKAGRVKIEFVNNGEDDHDLVLARRGGGKTVTFPTVAPGNRTTKTARLKRGKYRLWCSLSDHEARGMKASVRVTG